MIESICMACLNGCQHLKVEILGGTLSNDFATTLFSTSYYSSKKDYQFVECLRFGHGLFARVFSSHLHRQSQ
ncbi:hypothetical protein ACTXT7_010986 [Hymenolepis weldensis]